MDELGFERKWVIFVMILRSFGVFEFGFMFSGLIRHNVGVGY